MRKLSDIKGEVFEEINLRDMVGADTQEDDNCEEVKNGKELRELIKKNQPSNGRLPYSCDLICESIADYAALYVEEERKVTKNINPRLVDAVLVDAINYMATEQYSDFYVEATDLYEYRYNCVDDSQFLLNELLYWYPLYLFDQDVVYSVRNSELTEFKKKFNKDDAVLIIVDFLNFIASNNNYDRVFTASDLYNRYKEFAHIREMNQLRNFLESTDEFTRRLNGGQNIEKLYERVAGRNNLKKVSNNGVYYYTDDVAPRKGDQFMNEWDAAQVDKELCSLAYAYAKMTGKEEAGIKGIDLKIKEMKLK